MAKRVLLLVGLVAAVLMSMSSVTHAEIRDRDWKKIKAVNAKGSYLGIVTPNNWKVSSLIQYGTFVPDPTYPLISVHGKLFRIGTLQGKRVIIVETGPNMLNAAMTTYTLVSLFKISGLINYGSAGNANPAQQIGDVAIPQRWAHTGLWKWERFGSAAGNAEIGELKFASYNNVSNGEVVENFLNRISYQKEEIFPALDEVSKKVFWVSTSEAYYRIAQQLEDLELEQCVNATNCLPRKPVVSLVSSGVSADTLVDNKAYRDFLYSKFDATVLDTESAAVALVARIFNTRFISIRALSNDAGAGSPDEADVYGTLATKNSVTVVLKFISLLSTSARDHSFDIMEA